MRQIPARRWLGLTLDDLIALQLGPVRHTMSAPEPGILAAAAVGGAPERSLTVHLTEFVYRGQADPSDPGGIAGFGNQQTLLVEVVERLLNVVDVRVQLRGDFLHSRRVRRLRERVVDGELYIRQKFHAAILAGPASE